MRKGLVLQHKNLKPSEIRNVDIKALKKLFSLINDNVHVNENDTAS